MSTMVEGDGLRELLYDKMAMESLEYENLSIVYSGSELADKVDELCIRNIPGHFRKAHLEGVSSSRDILASLESEILPIAVTPSGNADSPVNDEFFAKPHVTLKPLSWLLARIEQPSEDRHYYFQSQDDNLNSLANCPVPKRLSLSTNFLGPQEAANLWIGTQGTTSRLHNDNYDNIYVQIEGTKRIYLVPPGSVLDVDEKLLEPATYNADMQLVSDSTAQAVADPGPDAGARRSDTPSNSTSGIPGAGKILFPTYNPAKDAKRGWMWAIDLEPGDVLFLPALWYHQVEILTAGVNISLNYWHKPFDDERRWAAWNFTRQIAQLVA